MTDLDSVENIHALFRRMHFVAIEVCGSLLELGEILNRTQASFRAVNLLIKNSSQAGCIKPETSFLRPYIRRQMKMSCRMAVHMAIQTPKLGSRVLRSSVGEHTDYNDGFVLPAAIQFSTWVAAVPRRDSTLSVRSENLSQGREFNLEDSIPKLNDWSDYVAGVARSCRDAGYHVRGANLLIRGEVPIGAGLSSSAALETAIAFALLSISGVPLDRTEIAMLCQKAENEFVGVRCGIMDQFVACHAQSDHVLFLDCRSLKYKFAPLLPLTNLAICNTMVRHDLADSGYNQRRSECEAGVRYLGATLPNIRALRDVSLLQLAEHGGNLPPAVYKRCRHVITENHRVLDAVTALQLGQLDRPAV